MTEDRDTVRRVPDVDLGSIFSNRTEGLGGLARRPRPQLPAGEQPASSRDSDAAEQDSVSSPGRTGDEPTGSEGQVGNGPKREAAPASRASTTQRRKRKSGETREDPSPVPRLVILQLPNDVADLLRVKARERGMTYKELTLDAIEATVDLLPNLIAAQRPRAREAGLFAGERVATQVRPEGRRQVSIKLTEPSIRSLDELADQLSARSRSELVSVALSAYLAD